MKTSVVTILSAAVCGLSAGAAQTAAATRTVDAHETPCISKAIALADGEVLSLRGTNADLRIDAPIIGRNATIFGSLGRPGSSNRKAIVNAPIDVDTILWGRGYGQSVLEIAVPGSRWKRLELSYSRVVCKAANVLAPEGALTWGSYYRGDHDVCATYDLGGFDQTVDRLDSTTSPKEKNSDHIVSSGGTLTMRGSADATCLGRVDGLLSLVWDPKGDFCQTFDERENGTAGKLTVRRGTLRLGAKGAFRRVQEIEVGEGAVFDCRSVLTQALASVRTVVLKKGARLKVGGADPFSPYTTTIICHPGAKVESTVDLSLRRQVAADTTPPQAIGDKLQVFWDEQIVNPAETTASRVPHRPEFAGTAIRFGKPWEGNAGCYASVVKVGDTWRMYRQATANCEVQPFYPGVRIVMFESKDGIVWERAKINRFPVYGERENNVLLDSELNFWDNFMVFEDANPSCPASERFKAIALYNHKWSEDFAKKHPDYAPLAKGGKALWCFVSSDGIDFKPGWKLFSFGDHGLRFDSLNVAFWDPGKKFYRMYMRSTKQIRPNRFNEKNARWAKVSESKDFHAWSEPVDISVDDGIDDYQLYTSGIDQYPRNPELIVGFPTRYTERKAWTDNYSKLCDATRRRERRGADSRHGLAITDCVFMWSRDGHSFRREEDAFLTPGPEHVRNWNYGNCYTQRGFVLSPGRRGDDPEYSFYVPVGVWGAGFLEIDRYALRQDGFVSYHGRYRTEKLVTKRVVFSGDELLVNFATSPGGRMYVTVRDEAGRSLRSCELFGDKVDRPVGFEGGSVGAFVGKPVTLEFELSDADVYSFRFHKAPAPVLRPIDAPALALRADKYERDLEAVGASNLTDAVRIPWLGALNMRYRVRGLDEDLAAAQQLFEIQKDAKRPHADCPNDGPLFADWLTVVDSHFILAKHGWMVRGVYNLASKTHPMVACYRWKYYHWDPDLAKAARQKLSADELPEDGLARLADRRALLAVGAKTKGSVAATLQGLQPGDAAAKARWLWAYWTARMEEGK